MFLFRIGIVCIFLAFAPATFAAYWVIDFEGTASGYVLQRGGAEIPLEKLMVLHSGDVLIASGEAGTITIVDQANKRHILTAGDPPFVVPDSEPVPSLLSNIHAWVRSWWDTRGDQTTRTTAAVSKGDLDPVITGVVNRESMLLAGTRRLCVAWRGGIAPFELRLVSASGKVLVELSDVDRSPIRMSEVSLQPGVYSLQLSDGGATDELTLSVVPEEHLPDTAREILAVDIPDDVRLSYLALFLSTEDAWCFEALQLAYEYDVWQLVDRLENER